MAESERDYLKEANLLPPKNAVSKVSSDFDTKTELSPITDK